MRKLLAGVFVATLMVLPAHAGTAVMEPVPRATRGAAVPADASLVYFLRPEDGTGTIRAVLFDDEYFVGQLIEETHVAYLTKPGKHLFSVMSTTMEFWEKTLEPGKTYYVTVKRRTPRHPFVFLEHDPSDREQLEQRVRLSEEMRPTDAGRRWIETRRENIRWMRSKYYGLWQQRQNGAVVAESATKP